MTWSAPARVARSAFCLAAHGGQDGGVGPAGELDRGVAHGPRATGHEDGPPAQGARPEPGRAVLGHGQAAVGSQERDPQAGAQVVRRRVGQWHHVRLREDGVLLSGAALGTQVRGLPHPHAATDQGGVHPGADRIDVTRTVLVGHLGRVDGYAGSGTTTGLPVGRVHPGAMEPDPHLPRPGLGDRCLHQGQDVGVTGEGVLDCAHAPHRTTWVKDCGLVAVPPSRQMPGQWLGGPAFGACY